MYQKIRKFFTRYERYFSPLMLLFGFVFDNLTLRRVDFWAENLVIIIYLGLALISIILINIHASGRLRHRFFAKTTIWLSLLLQFVFGGLWSAFFIFYFRGASLALSWPFLLMLLALLIGNETFRERYSRLVFQLSIFFTALFSYSIFAIPLLFKKIGPDMFVLSGLASLAIFAAAAILAFRLIPERFRKSRLPLVFSITSIYLIFNFFYFFNLIPPLPLSLNEIGIYHSLRSAGGKYTVSYEPAPWYRFWADTSPIFHWRPGAPVYCLSTIFAPADFSLGIKHRWSHYDENVKVWTVKDELSFPLTGGRAGGYRGYSLKYGVEPGRWRIGVLTDTDRALGRINFQIVETEDKLEFKSEIK